MASGSGGANRAAVAIGPALPQAALRNAMASVRSALACQVATVARPPVIDQFLRPCRDLLTVSPIRLDRAREQSGPQLPGTLPKPWDSVRKPEFN